MAGVGAQRVPGDLGIVVAVVVDKPGRDGTAVGVDRPLGRTAQFADLDDLSVFDRDIAAESRHPRAIDDAAVTDQQIIRHHYPFRCSGHASNYLRQSLARRIGATRTAKLTARSSVLAWLECRGAESCLGRCAGPQFRAGALR